MAFINEISLRALNDAMKIRLSNNIDLTTPLDIFKFATDLGIEVRFINLASLEAMYVKNPPLIIISSQRSFGRQAFDCAHELGHHIYGHGSKIDEYSLGGYGSKNFNPEEFLADRFASFLLMPKMLVNRVFVSRGWKITESSAVDFYTAAGWIGVGYSTLIIHMRDSLNLLTNEKAQELLQATPKSIRQDLVAGAGNSAVVIVDHHWTGRAVDIQVGDYVRIPSEFSLTGEVLGQPVRDGNISIYQAVKPGIGRFFCSSPLWAAFIRVSKPGYIGRSIFRHLEDPEYA